MPQDPKIDQYIDQRIGEDADPAAIAGELREKFGWTGSPDYVFERDYQYWNKQLETAQQTATEKRGNMPAIAGLALSGLANYPAFKSGNSIAKLLAGVDTAASLQDNLGRESVITPSNVASSIGALGNAISPAIGAATQNMRKAPIIQAGYGALEGAAAGGLPGLAEPVPEGQTAQPSPLGGLLGGLVGSVSGYNRGSLSRGGLRSETYAMEQNRPRFAKMEAEQDPDAWAQMRKDAVESLNLRDEADLYIGSSDYQKRLLELSMRTGFNPLAFKPEDLETIQSFTKRPPKEQFEDLLDMAVGPSADNLDLPTLKDRVGKLGSFVRLTKTYQGEKASKNLAGAAAGYVVRQIIDQSPTSRGDLLARIGSDLPGFGGAPTVSTNPAARALVEEIFAGQPKAYEQLQRVGQSINTLRDLAKHTPSVRAWMSTGGHFSFSFGNTVGLLRPSQLAEAILQGKAPLLIEMNDTLAKYTRELMKNPMAKGDITRMAQREIARLSELLGGRTITPREDWSRSKKKN